MDKVSIQIFEEEKEMALKKKLVVPILAFTLIGCVVAGTSVLNQASAASHGSSEHADAPDKENINNLKKEAKLSSNEAEAIAVKAVPGTVKDSELEDEDGTVVYGVEVHTADGKVKDVKVDAKTGKVVKVDQDGQDENGSSEHADAPDKDNINNLKKEAKLSSNEAKAIAVKKVPGTVKDAELEDEDGTVVYGVEVHTADSKVKDVKVDAQTGKVVKVDQDGQDENGSQE
jgi:uncharacterized membrane protein YkoI